MCCDESVRLDVIRLKRCVGHLCTEVSTLRRQVNGADSSQLRGVEQQVQELSREYTKRLQALREERERNGQYSCDEFTKGFLAAVVMFDEFKRRMETALEASSEELRACDSRSSVEELLKRIEQQGCAWRLFSPPFNSYGYVHNRDKCPDITKYELIVWNSEHRHREFYGDTLREAVERAVATVCSQC